MRTVVQAILALFVVSSTAAARDNFLILIADDVGVDRVAVYSRDDLYGHPGEGATPGPTPHIDQLAAEGLLFRNAWASPFCSPTRASVLTGRFGFRTGVGNVVQPTHGLAGLPLAETTLPELLVGHRSALVGKWHVVGSAEEPYPNVRDCQCDPDHPRHQGFESHQGTLRNIPADDGYFAWPKVVDGVFVGPHPVYATTDTVDDAIARIAAFGDEPWLVWVAFNAAHVPLHAPPSALHSFALSGAPADSPVEHAKAMVEAMDSEIGRLLAAIPAAILADTTIVFFGDDGTDGAAVEPPADPLHAKGTFYEGGLNVPLIVASPHIPPSERGREVQALVGLVDVYATLAELAGVLSAAEDSVSLVPYFTMPDLPTEVLHPLAYAEHFEPNGPGPYTTRGRAVRDARYKLIWRDGVYEEFFDLEADPGETTNLLPVASLTTEQQQRYDALEAALASWDCVEGGACPGPFEPTYSPQVKGRACGLGAELALLLIPWAARRRRR